MNSFQKKMFKTLLPGLLPLLVFIVVETLLGVKAGIFAALGIGIFELFIIYIREKRYEKFVLLDTLLIVSLGGISLLLDNEVFFKWKTAIMGGIFTVVLGISGFSSKNVIFSLTKRYLRGITFSSFQIATFKKMVQRLFYLFVFHTVLVIYSIYFMSHSSWAFISGPGLYILIAIPFLSELFFKRFELYRYRNDAILPIVSEDGKIIGKAPRTLCHQGNFLLHPVVQVVIVNKKDEILLQKRSKLKKIEAGKWDSAIGGHMSYGETLEETLEKESWEEMGVKNLPYRFVQTYVHKHELEHELVYLFTSKFDSLPTNFNRKEIDEFSFFLYDEIKKMDKQMFTPCCIKNLDILFKKK